MITRAHPLRSSAIRVIVLAVVLTALNAMAAIPSNATAGWNHEVLDPGISTGEGTSTIYWPPFSQHHVFNVGMESGASVLRHGWFAPGYGGWAFQTLDAGNSTGRASATGLWAHQHHVFNEGDESGTPVLRHGWYQDGGPGWQFETLDAGTSTGTDTAYADYAGQQHVFTHGISPTGEDILRHGYYDPGVGSWTFETLDQGFSGGAGLSTTVWRNQLHYFNWLNGTIAGLRHGWYEPGTGWKFETLVASPEASADASGTVPPPFFNSAGLSGIDGNQYVQFSGLYNRGFYKSPFGLTQAWYSPTAGHWNLSHSMAAGSPYPDGRGGSVTQYGAHTEVFDYGSDLSGNCVGLYHAYWDGSIWLSEIRPAPCQRLAVAPPDLVKSRATASATFPPYNQLHAFYAQDPPALGHFWYNPA